MKAMKQWFFMHKGYRRILSLVMAFAMLLSLCSGLSVRTRAAGGGSIKVTDLVQVKIGDTLTTLELYRNGVFEAKVPVSAGTNEAVLVINGEETEISTALVTDVDEEIWIRVQDGVLAPVTVMPCALVGNFWGLNFVDDEGERFDISSWAPSDPNAELAYLGGGMYGRTFKFQPLEADVPLADGGYKVAFNDNWDYPIGNGSDNIALTIPAGSTSLTVLVDEINKVVYDNVRSGSFTVAQNSGAIQKEALTTTISLIGDVRGDNDFNWSAGAKGYEFTRLSDTLYRYQKTFEAGTYNYKCVFDYTNWYEAEATNREFTLTEKTHVVFLYDTVSGKLYDTVNNTAAVGEMLGMQAPPAEMKVVDNANGTTTFIATGEDGQAVTLFYCNKETPRMGESIYLGKCVDGSAKTDDLFLGDEALDILYWYEIDGVRTLDASKPIVTVEGMELSLIHI